MLLKLKVRKKEKKKQNFLKSVSKGATEKYINKIHHRDIFDLEDF